MNTLSKMLTVLAASAALATSAYAQNSRKNDHSSAILLEVASVSSLAEHPALETLKEGATETIDRGAHPPYSRTAESDPADEPVPHRVGAESFPKAGYFAAPVCGNTNVNAQVREALSRVCDRPVSEMTPSSINGLIVVGFLGGFVEAHESKHPEVWFGRYLSERYSSATKVATYSNHEARAAMADVLQLLDTNHDGVLTASEKAQAKIILYGHSWGASEVASFARDLEQHGVPVLLTVQIDIVRKPGQEPTHIPPNVKAAANLFQSEGLLRGRSEIVAEDPERTKIIGNFRMKYGGHHVDCRNYPLLPRTFNKPHHEIENDPWVWDRIATLIDSYLFVF